MPTIAELEPLLAAPAEALDIEYKGSEQRPNLISEPCPPGIAAYDQDLINQIIRRFAVPAFHSSLTMLAHPVTGHQHAVIGIPGGFAFPVISKSGTPGKRSSPTSATCGNPESAPPENQGDWERLLLRWLRNRREDMIDAIRASVEGRRAGGDPRSPHGRGSPRCIRTRGTRTLGSPYRPSFKRCTGALSFGSV